MLDIKASPFLSIKEDLEAALAVAWDGPLARNFVSTDCSVVVNTVSTVVLFDKSALIAVHRTGDSECTYGVGSISVDLAIESQHHVIKRYV